MAKLEERTVQEVALKYLEKYYKRKARRRKIFSKIEVRTKKKYGGKRADGFLAFKKRFRRKPYVVSMESKSYKTQKVITPRLDKKMWRRNSIWYGLYIAVGSGSWFAAQNFDKVRWVLLFPLITWIVASILAAWVTKNWDRNKTMDVLSQIDQYPGNEQWFSTSKDSYDNVPFKDQDAFKKVVKARGFGLLLVNKRKQVILVHKPKKKRFRPLFGDYLKYYSLEKDIRKYLK